jgi:predicted alpha/beta-fold hydrolase
MFGAGSLTYSSAPETVQLALKSGYTDDGDGKKQVSLLDLAKSAMPPIRLNPFLPGGNLQTMWTAVGGADVPVFYKRRIFKSSYEKYAGQFAVDFATETPENPPPNEQDLPQRTHNFTEEEFSRLESSNVEKPLLIILHGLSGGSDEQYLRHLIQPLTSLDVGFDACVINARGCAKSKITSKIMYNARATWDLRQLVQWARKTWPKRRLFALGFSLGANILTNYAGEEGEDCILEAVISVCNPWNLEICNVVLNSTWIGLNIYSASMGKGMRALAERYFVSKSRDCCSRFSQFTQTRERDIGEYRD